MPQQPCSTCKSAVWCRVEQRQFFSLVHQVMYTKLNNSNKVDALMYHIQHLPFSLSLTRTILKLDDAISLRLGCSGEAASPGNPFNPLCALLDVLYALFHVLYVLLHVHYVLLHVHYALLYVLYALFSSGEASLHSVCMCSMLSCLCSVCITCALCSPDSAMWSRKQLTSCA